MAQGDQLELLVIIQVKNVDSWDQVGVSKTGDKLSSSVYNFTFGYLSSSLSFPALIPSSPQLWGTGSQLFRI